MARGRPRKHDPTIPRHIDQTRLPRGIYWQRQGAGRWYVFVPDPEGGPKQLKTVAGQLARLEDPQAIMARLAGDNARGTIGYVHARYEESTDFTEKSTRTRKGYQYCARVTREFRTDKGKGPSLDTLYVD